MAPAPPHPGSLHDQAQSRCVHFDPNRLRKGPEGGFTAVVTGAVRNPTEVDSADRLACRPQAEPLSDAQITDLQQAFGAKWHTAR